MKRKLLLLLATITLVTMPLVTEAVQTKQWEYAHAENLSNIIEPGKHKIGDKISAGEYKIFAKKETAYIALFKDSDGKEMIKNESFKTQTYLSVSDGQLLELRDCYAVKFDEKNNELKSEKFSADYFEGTFKVGYDIPAGEYTIEGLSTILDSGYWSIQDDKMKLISKELFKKSAVLKVEDGQYLTLSGAIIKK